MKKSGNILIIDDNSGVRSALQLLLKPYFNRIEVLPSPVTLPTLLNAENWQVILTHSFECGKLASDTARHELQGRHQ